MSENNNQLGLAGFIVGIASLFIGWIPLLGALPCLLAILLSGIALFKKPRGMAIAGLLLGLTALAMTQGLFALAIFAHPR